MFFVWLFVIKTVYSDVSMHPMNVRDHARSIPNSKVHGVLSAPDGPHVGPMNLALRDLTGVI